jgi:hypothetical protein
MQIEDEAPALERLEHRQCLLWTTDRHEAERHLQRGHLGQTVLRVDATHLAELGARDRRLARQVSESGELLASKGVRSERGLDRSRACEPFLEDSIELRDDFRTR